MLALVFSLMIEVSQLYHAPWIDASANALGGLVLGFGFVWSDLVCYLVGVGFGVFIERGVAQLRRAGTELDPHDGDGPE